jgi:hypothetical protein
MKSACASFVCLLHSGVSRIPLIFLLRRSQSDLPRVNLDVTSFVNDLSV